MRAAFFTLGCKVNQYETAVLEQLFAGAGYDIATIEEEAEIYVINSCTVTAEGDRKTRQMLRRIKRRHPTAIVCLTGCFPQAFPDTAETILEADVVTGSRNRAGLLEAVRERLQGGARVVRILPHEKKEAFEPMHADVSSRTRAFLKIQDGCDRYCSYCIIPTARGPVRSRTLVDLNQELAALAASGYKEVVLTGINLPCYGRDLGLGLIDAIRTACAVPGIRRVRMGSLEPELLCPADIAAMVALPNLCPQFHLALQSGCDETLRRMRRRYTTAEFRRIVTDLRAAFPRCAITTDIMVGFPGESEDEFLQSLAFAEEIGFAKAHVFAYSQRPGTDAAEMAEQVSAEEKRRRAKQMAAVTDRTRSAFLQAQIGTSVFVLAEQKMPGGEWEGYAENYTPVRFLALDAAPGHIVRVRITGAEGECCTGVLSE